MDRRFDVLVDVDKITATTILQIVAVAHNDGLGRAHSLRVESVDKGIPTVALVAIGDARVRIIVRCAVVLATVDGHIVVCLEERSVEHLGGTLVEAATNVLPIIN